MYRVITSSITSEEMSGRSARSRARVLGDLR